MNLRLHTEDIQKLMICVLFSDDTSIVSTEDKQRYADVLTTLNNMCVSENNYTLAVSVDDAVH